MVIASIVYRIDVPLCTLTAHSKFFLYTISRRRHIDSDHSTDTDLVIREDSAIVPAICYSLPCCRAPANASFDNALNVCRSTRSPPELNFLSRGAAGWLIGPYSSGNL